MEDKKQKILFLYTKAGNGHYAIANSLKGELEEKYNDDVILVDALENGSKFFKYFACDFYNNIISKGNLKIIFEFFYLINESFIICNISNFFMQFACYKNTKKAIKEYNPDKIVNVHFYYGTCVRNILKKEGVNTPVLTVVTDPFTAPRFWYLNKKSKYISFSEKIKKQAIFNGVKEDNVKIYSPIINKKYSSKLSIEQKNILKEKYGVNNGKKNILVLFGGTGLPNGVRIVKNILKENNNANIIVVCGRCSRSFNAINKIIEKENITNIKLFGFVDFVFDLINIADIVVTKAGTSTIYEILSQNKVPVICDYIWGQEKGTVDYIVKNNFGIYQKNHNKIGKSIRDILDNNLYIGLENNIQKESLKNGLEEVTDYIQNEL